MTELKSRLEVPIAADGAHEKSPMAAFLGQPHSAKYFAQLCSKVFYRVLMY